MWPRRPWWLGWWHSSKKFRLPRSASIRFSDPVQIRWQAFVEILLITLGVLYVYRLFRGTRGARVLSGFVVVLATLVIVSVVLELRAISLLLQAFSAFLVLALIIIFQPELRRVLAEVGSTHVFQANTRQSFLIENIVQALENLREQRQGALIALERTPLLDAVKQSGVLLDAALSEELLVTLFTNKTPLHDGGVVIAGSRIVAAGCIFPVTQRHDLNRQLGLRHRAAIGLSEESDAVVVVLSEESGEIAYCERGELIKLPSIDSLRQKLSELFLPAAGQKQVSWVDRLGEAVRSLRGAHGPQNLTTQFGLEIAVALAVAVLIWLIVMQGESNRMILIEP